MNFITDVYDGQKHQHQRRRKAAKEKEVMEYRFLDYEISPRIVHAPIWTHESGNYLLR